MAEIAKLNIAELDFDSIKNNLKDYFTSQTEFTDHDFGGSAISVMLDILAYNTYYNAYYVNMLASESFLDSAQLRDSVVSKASMLGYTPQSSTGAKANVYAVPLTAEVNCVYLSIVTEAGASVGVTEIPTFAFAPVDDCGVYPNIDAFATTESRNCAESKKDSLASILR
jgi:hypothetical protein